MQKNVFSTLLMAALLGFGTASFAADKPTEAVAITQNSAMISLNTAGVDVLSEALVGVGKAKAEAIVAYRTEHGPFESVDELLEVKGIGAAILEKNRSRLAL